MHRTNRTLGYLIGSALVASLVLAGCGSKASTSTSTSTSTAAPATTSSTSSTKTSVSTSATAINTAVIFGELSTCTANTTVPGAACIKYNTSVFLSAGASGPSPGFGPNNDFDSKGAPAAGAWAAKSGSTSVSFLFPSTANNALNSLAIPYGSAAGFSVPSGQYSNLYLLDGVRDGPDPFTALLKYSNGTTQSVTFGVDDWCTYSEGKTLLSDDTEAWQAVDRVAEVGGATGTVGTGGCGLYVTDIPISNTNTLTDVVIENNLTTVPSSLSSAITSVNTGNRLNIIAATVMS